MPAIEIRRPLQGSSPRVTQQELLGKDIDIDKFKLVIQNTINPFGKNVADRIVSADITRTVQGASTLNVSILDQDRELWQSGNFGSKVDVLVDGLWFRLADISKQGDILGLTFEDRSIGILRTYNSFIAPIPRTSMTRAEFILRLLKEVREITIPYDIPELHDKQPVFNRDGAVLSPAVKVPGINPGENLRVKNAPASPIQIGNAELILVVGDGEIDDTNPHKRKLLVCSIMTAIQESQLQNLPDGDLDSQGIFQQRPKEGYHDVTDVVQASIQFFTRAIAYDAKYPNATYNDLCQGVQISGFPNAYGQWLGEAQNFVDAYGAPGGDALANQASSNAQQNYGIAEGRYHFYRGIPPTRKNGGWQPESSWACIQRLAQEVNWDAFFVSDTFYYLSEDSLFKSKPRAILSEDSEGVDDIDCSSYDPNKKVAEVTVNLRMGRWIIPPGSIVKLEKCGPCNGRWLVTTIERDMFNPSGTLTLNKANPAFMEPNSDSLPNAYSGTNTVSKSPTGSPSKLPASYPEPEWSDIKFLANVIIQANGSNPKRYFDDNGQQMYQWRSTAAGNPLKNQCGSETTIDIRIAQMLVTLLENGYYIGTYALMSDHSCYVEGTTRFSAHSLGMAVDISSIGKPGLGTKSLAVYDPIAVQWVEELMILLRTFNPKQIICNGEGNQENLAIKQLQWNNGQQVDNITTDHTTHIHVGFSA